jgi:tetratricopeptide (TPR) repeat protein
LYPEFSKGKISKFIFYFVPKDILLAQIYCIINDAQMAKKHYKSVFRLLEEKIKEDPEDSRYHSALGIAYAGLGFKEKAIGEAKMAAEILPLSKEAYRGAFRATGLALVYTMVGEYDQPLDKIESLLSSPGEMSLPLPQVDPRWDTLKESHRFQRLIEQGY